MEVLIKRLYAILFVAGEEGVQISQLVDHFKVSPEEIVEGIAQLNQHLKQEAYCPLEIMDFHQTYRLLTRQEVEADLEGFAQSSLNQTLSRAAIETLAIIAYRQPITRLEIDQIRGVSSSAMIQKLLLRDLVKEVGRVEAPGRPVLYGTTPYFMNYFGLESMEDLPEVEPLSASSQLTSNNLFDMKEWEIEWFEEEK